MHPTDRLHPQTGYTQEPGAMPRLALPACLALLWQLATGGAEVGTTHMAPSPKGQASPAWKWCPHCLPSFPISGCPACRASLGQGWGKGPQEDPKGMGGLMAGEGQEGGGSPKGWQVTPEIVPEGGSLCMHPGPASLGMLRRWGGGAGGGSALWFHGASVPFEFPCECGGGKMSPAGPRGRGPGV